MAAQRPKYVPLPDIGEYTDRLEVASLGLPVGFDQERLTFNVGAIERVIKWGDLGRVTVASFEGQSNNIDVGIDGVDDQGTATSSGRSSATKSDLEQVNLNADSSSSDSSFMGDMLDLEKYYERPDVTIRLDAAEKERRINKKAKKWPRGTFDPSAQASLIDEGLRNGLKAAAYNKHFRDGRMDETTAIAAGIILSDLPFTISEGPAAFKSAMFVVPFINAMHALYSTTKGLPTSQRHWSYFIGVPFDRHVISKVKAQRTLVKSV